METASQRAYRIVKERILDGTLPGAELLTEVEVAGELGMSRTPVRAAFAQLEAEGYLKLYPKRGAIIAPVTPREAESVIETRWVIERYALEQAPPELGEKLAAIIDAGGDFVEADRAFHRALVASTGNEILLALYDTLRDRQRRMTSVYSRSEERRELITAEHHEIAAAIAAGEDAAPLLRRHLDGTLVAIRATR